MSNSRHLLQTVITEKFGIYHEDMVWYTKTFPSHFIQAYPQRLTCYHEHGALKSRGAQMKPMATMLSPLFL